MILPYESCAGVSQRLRLNQKCRKQPQRRAAQTRRPSSSKTKSRLISSSASVDFCSEFNGGISRSKVMWRRSRQRSNWRQDKNEEARLEVGLFVARIDAFDHALAVPYFQPTPLMRTERLYCSVCVFLLQCHGRLRRSITRSAKELRPRKKAVSFRYMPRVRASLSIRPGSRSDASCSLSARFCSISVSRWAL